MKTIDVTIFKKDVYELLERTVMNNETLKISTQNGNAVVISEEYYNSLVETIDILSNPKLKQEIKKGINESVEKSINEKDVRW